MWQRPRGVQEVELAGRRTIARNTAYGHATIITVTPLPLADAVRPPPAAVAGETPLTTRRTRALLAEVSGLHRRRLAGRRLDPLQLAKLAREGPLRQALAGATWRAKWRTLDGERPASAWACP
eukprot:15914947-Heterocapsa_arctica.AAC.1